MDPLKPLRRLPVSARRYYYGVLASLQAVVLTVAVAAGADAAVVGAVTTAFLGLAGALLAIANTPHPPK